MGDRFDTAADGGREEDAAGERSASRGTEAPRDADPVFRAEQEHLSETYAKLLALRQTLAAKLAKIASEAAADIKAMGEEIAQNFESAGEAQETYVDFATANSVVDAYNLAADANARKLSDVELLLGQPYFAKISLRFKPEDAPKDLYIGTAGISDESCRRLVVDWRSPVAEVYYNQANGPTSYVANGRTIKADLVCRRQFDIDRDLLNAYFDTTVAIEDALLLASLSKHRSEHMQAITATIQREQNLVIRHDDVPALLVAGIAGSGKTSVLLQRIAYLFYRRRESLDPREIFLITPNPVFRSYIDRVLPELGESNPHLVTWDEFAGELLPPGHSRGGADEATDTLRAIDERLVGFELEPEDFRDLRVGDLRLVSAAQIASIRKKHGRIETGPRLVALMREDVMARLEGRLAQLASKDDTLDEIASLPLDEQIRILNQPFDPQNEEEARECAVAYLRRKLAPAFEAVERDEWLRLDRIGMRLLGAEGISAVAWLYLKIALTGLGNADAKYVMIDEVQDYTAAQLSVLARYFRRAHFLLLGDENQAIEPNTATFDEVKRVFSIARGNVDECRLLTSYRSSPEITDLFSRLAPPDDRTRISSVQPGQGAPRLIACADDAHWERELRDAVDRAQREEGLAAVVCANGYEAKLVAKRLGEGAPRIVGDHDALPPAGVVIVPLKLAKGLEFDRVIVPDASARAFPADDDLARRRLYTTVSRATHGLEVLARGELTPLLAR